MIYIIKKEKPRRSKKIPKFQIAYLDNALIFVIKIGLRKKMRIKRKN